MSSPNGYHENGSGLLVPTEAVRVREVWTDDEFRLLNRVGKLLRARGMTFSLSCLSAECQHDQMSIQPRPGGGSILRCKCKDRIFERAF